MPSNEYLGDKLWYAIVEFDVCVNIKMMANKNTNNTNKTLVIVRIIENIADSLIPTQLMNVVNIINVIARNFDV